LVEAAQRSVQLDQSGNDGFERLALAKPREHFVDRLVIEYSSQSG
jgi:hypothetical protein